MWVPQLSEKNVSNPNLMLNFEAKIGFEKYSTAKFSNWGRVHGRATSLYILNNGVTILLTILKSWGFDIASPLFLAGVPLSIEEIMFLGRIVP